MLILLPELLHIRVKHKFYVITSLKARIKHRFTKLFSNQPICLLELLLEFIREEGIGDWLELITADSFESLEVAHVHIEALSWWVSIDEAGSEVAIEHPWLHVQLSC